MSPNDANCYLESQTVTDFFGSRTMRELFSDRNIKQAWLDVEAALAQGQAALGIIPEDAARVIGRCADVDELDLREISEHAAATGHPLVPLIRALTHRCGEPAGAYVHLGATTQDVMDTGYVLRAKAGLAKVDRLLAEMTNLLRKLAFKHRRSVMAGRTHGQHALPTTFGLRAAGWCDELDRHRARLAEMRPRLLTGSLGGAVGTLAGYGPKAIQLQRLVMDELGLNVPATSWHSNQDRFAECVAVLGLIASSCEKLAREVYFLSRTEIAEAAEAQGPDQVGSSTMPHKANPIRCEAVIAASAGVRAQVPLAMSAMVSQDDRDMGSGMILWKLIPETFILAGGVLERMIEVVKNLRIDPERMRSNLETSGGLIVSEAVMLKLAGRIGREAAHEVVTEAVGISRETGRGFADCLAGHPGINGHLSSDDIHALLDPDAYTGAAEEIVETFLSKGAEHE